MEKNEYWGGNKNHCIRYWFYINRGMDFINQFRNLFLLIIGVYFALKLNNPLWLLGMFSLSLPLLAVAGYFQVHHVGKVVDWLNVKFSTHFSNYNFELLENILKELRKMNETRSK